jgi:phosphonate transport system permease protein
MAGTVAMWPTRSGWPPAGALAAGAAILALLAVAAPAAEIDPVRVIDSLGAMADFAGHLLVAPDWSYLPDLATKMLETLAMAFLATVIAAVLSLPLGILAARNATPHVAISHLTRQLLSVMRALPELMWALVFVSAVGLGPLPGVMALAFVATGFLGKFFAETIEAVDTGPVEGVAAHGAGWLQVRRYAILPQVAPDFIGIVLYILDHNLRAATVLGLVGAGGIGYDMVMSMRLFQYDRIGLIALAIYVAVTVLDRASDQLRRRVI